MGTTSTVPLESLLAQREWVRALARTLIRNDADAADLEQQVWYETLRRPPAHAGNLRAWFARLLRRRARDTLRGDSRRGDHMAELARERPGGPAPSTVDLVAEAEAQQTVVRWVLELDDPDREIVLLRYFRSLGAEEAAVRLGIPVETGRTRLRRALERLRRRAGEERGGTPGAAGLLALAAGPVGGAPAPSGGPAASTGLSVSSILGGALVMSTAKVVVGAVVVAAGLGWWVLGRDLPPAVDEALIRPVRPTPARRVLAAAPDPEPAPGPVPEVEEAEAEEDGSAIPVTTGEAAVDRPVSLARAALVAHGDLPSLRSVQETPEGPQVVVLDVDDRGAVSVGDRALDMVGLRELLKEHAESFPMEGKPKLSRADVVLRTHASLPWRGAQLLMQECAMVRVGRIHYAATAGGGREGSVPMFLPADEGVEAAGVGVEEEEEQGGKPEALSAPSGVDLPPRVSARRHPASVSVRLSMKDGGVPVTAEDLRFHLESRFESSPFRVEDRDQELSWLIDAQVSVPLGEVLAVSELLRSLGRGPVVYKGAPVPTSATLEEALGSTSSTIGVLSIRILDRDVERAPR